MIERLLLLLRLRLCTGPAFLRCRTLGGRFRCRASLRPARFLRYRSRRSHAAHSSWGSRFPALPFGRSGGNRRSLCASLRYRLFCAAALCGNWALRSALFCRTRRIRPRGRARRRISFAVGRWWCRRYQCCGCGMLPICGAAIHTDSAGRLHRAAGLLRGHMVLLCDLGVSIRGNARRLLHRLGIASADGRALRSCCTGRWRILRSARLLRPRTSSCGIAGGCGMRIWLFSCYTVLCGNWRCAAVWHRRISCHTGSWRSRRSRMICCWLRACHVWSLHKGAALLRRFCMCRLHLTFSCAADRLCRAARSAGRRSRSVWRCIGRGCIRCAPLCIRRLHKGAALLCRLGLYRLPLCVAAVIRLSCGTGRLNSSARWILACRFSRCAVQNSSAVILHRRAAARMGFRLGMYGLLLLRVLRARAAHDRLRSSCGTIRRTGRGFSCRGRCMVLRRCHVARCTSGAGRHSSFARRVGLLAGASRRGLWECARHLFGGGLYGIRLCSNRLSRNRFLIECRIRAVLLRRRAMMIAVCVRGRIDIGHIAAASARAGRCIRLRISAAAALLTAVPADGMRCIGHH